MSVDHASGGFELDPLLELATILWHRTAGDDRAALEERARGEPVFPVRRNDDRTLDRVALGDDTAFFPPRSARQDLPLRGLRFMCHAVCWGALNQNERLTLLDERIKAWTSLFDVREFRFETVVQAAVLPALVLNPDRAALDLLETLRDEHALAAVCQLAGRFTKPDRPLRYQRLQSDRALLNLSRLPVPCRTDAGERWLPAYRVYFGADWIGDQSVERVADAVPDDESARPEFAYLALARAVRRASRRTRGRGDERRIAEADSDEVEADEDADQAIETDEHDRWIAFLSWIGVNRALRPVHFHDVEDDATGWLTTRNLAQPQGWAFRDLGDTWTEFEASLRAALAARNDAQQTVPYLYDAHDLDQIVPLVQAAENDASGVVARALTEHLVRHWSWFLAFADCQVALVDDGQVAEPAREAAAGPRRGADRRRRQPLAAPAAAPRDLPDDARSAAAERDVAAVGGARAPLRPGPAQLRRAPARARALRGPAASRGSTRSPSDSVCAANRRRRRSRSRTRGCCAAGSRSGSPIRSARSTGGSCGTSSPCTGSCSSCSAATRATPVTQAASPTRRCSPTRATACASSPRREILYAGTPGMRERSGVAGTVPTFVLEAEPAATAPLTRLFGVRTLEDALEWNPEHGRVPVRRGADGRGARGSARTRARRCWRASASSAPTPTTPASSRSSSSASSPCSS